MNYTLSTDCQRTDIHALAYYDHDRRIIYVAYEGGEEKAREPIPIYARDGGGEYMTTLPEITAQGINHEIIHKTLLENISREACSDYDAVTRMCLYEIGFDFVLEMGL